MVILFSSAAAAPACWDNQWSADVYRVSTMAGIAMQLGIRNDAQVSEVADPDAATTFRTVDEMRKRNLGMFADLSKIRVGDNVEVGKSQLTVVARATRFDVDWPAGTYARTISGELPQPLAAQEQGAELWFADANGTLIGRAAFTNVGSKPRTDCASAFQRCADSKAMCCSGERLWRCLHVRRTGSSGNCPGRAATFKLQFS